jgi:hypothetical protein
MWLKDLDVLGKRVCELYPFLCEFCSEKGHFNFQCPINQTSKVALANARALFLGFQKMTTK